MMYFGTTLPYLIGIHFRAGVWSGLARCWGGGLTNQSLKYIEPTRAFCKRASERATSWPSTYYTIPARHLMSL